MLVNRSGRFTSMALSLPIRDRSAPAGNMPVCTYPLDGGMFRAKRPKHVARLVQMNALTNSTRKYPAVRCFNLVSQGSRKKQFLFLAAIFPMSLLSAGIRPHDTPRTLLYFSRSARQVH